MDDNYGDMIDQDHLREMIEVISGELELRPLLTTIVQKACELLHADRGSIGLVDPKERLVKIEAIYRMPPEEQGAISRPGEGLAGRVYRDVAPVLLDNYADVGTPLLEGMDSDSVVGMPIVWRGDIIGTFGIGAAPPKRFGDNDIRTLEVFARHAAIAINNARSYEREGKYAALKERQRLARDLHDNVSQLIFSISLLAQSIGSAFQKDHQEGEARANRLLEVSQLAQSEMKALLKELKGTESETSNTDMVSMADYARRYGLAHAIEQHCKMISIDGLNTEIAVDDRMPLTGAQSETLLRITQEAIANAVRHGGACNIRFALQQSGNDVVFTIDDDGAGLGGAPENVTMNAKDGAHMGIASMRARAESAGGKLTVNNRENEGVRVEVRLPLQ